MITCTNCSVQSPEGTKFCPNCGQDLVAQQAAATAAQPPAAAPPPAQPTAPQMPAQTPPPAAPPPAAPPPPVEPPAAYSAPPAASGGGGGIGMSGKIAAAVGAVVILGGVFAGVRLLTGNDDKPAAAATTNGGSTEEEPEPVETTTPEPVETTAAPEEVPTSEPTEAPDSGAVSDILQDPVGTWTLEDLAQSPDIAQAWGATDALSALYVNPNGQQVGLTIAAYTSPEEAFSTVPVLAESLLGGRGKNRFQVVDAGEVTDQNGQLIGQYVLLEGPVEIIFWSNGPFIRAVEGTPGSAIDFYTNSSY